MASIAVRKVMRSRRAGTLTFLVLALMVAALISVVLAARPALSVPTTFTVNSTDDAGDASPEGTCDSDTSEAVVCTLREAIQEANANNNPTETDTINFAIPDAGPHKISPTSDLPLITETVTINGYSESLGEGTPASPNSRRDLAEGTNANLLIELSGGSIAGSNGLIQISASDVVVKGLVLKCYNSGINITGGSGNVIRGNFIGINDPSCNTANDGVVVFQSSHDNTIGGTSPAARNVISGNSSQGLSIGGDGGNTIQGNLIGTKANGTDPLGNIEGVEIFSPNNTVGGIDRDPTDAISPGNLIAHNGEGVQITGGIGNAFAVGNRILSNSIHSNGGSAEGALGIDLDGGEGFTNPDGDGVTRNDDKDPDTGPNNLQNFPRLTAFTTASDTTTIFGTLNSHPGNAFIIQFFSSAQADTSRFGEGEVYLGKINVKTKDNGVGRFTFAVDQNLSGQVVTATATRVSTGDTSEFSKALVVN